LEAEVELADGLSDQISEINKAAMAEDVVQVESPPPTPASKSSTNC
jgi:hypothetical protein